MKLTNITLFTLLSLSTLFSNEQKIIDKNEAYKFSNLVWEDKKNSRLEEKSWNFAQNYCKNLTTGNKKWRLPTFDELKSFNNQSKTKNIIQDDYYWSSTKNPEDKSEIRIFDISNQNSCEGIINQDTYYTLCVTQNK